MDHADIAAENDFSTEKLNQMRGNQPKVVERGTCLYCAEELEPVRIKDGGPLVGRLYCDADCRIDYESEQLVLSRQRRK